MVRLDVPLLLNKPLPPRSAIPSFGTKPLPSVTLAIVLLGRALEGTLIHVTIAGLSVIFVSRSTSDLSKLFKLIVVFG